MRKAIFLLIVTLFSCSSCTIKNDTNQLSERDIETQDSIIAELSLIIDSVYAKDITIKKDLLYDKYTLEDVYPYKDTTRVFQWDKIRENLAFLETIQKTHSSWAILQNYKNKNKEAPLVRNFKRNEYNRVSDSLGVERYQSVPLYLLNDSTTAERYGRDGSLVKLIANHDSSSFVRVENVNFGGEWIAPKKYVKILNDTTVFKKAIFVDVTNQNITTLEKADSISTWLVRSMNPATTGRHRPPYAQETPVGVFVVQEKKVKMVYLKDGSPEVDGFAPYASRFTNGAYIHGVPVKEPRTDMIEYSYSLGTIPRSHMCVRNATSHAKFVYGWAPSEATIIFVIN